MKKLIGGLAFVAVMGAWAAPAVAQLSNMPVYTSPAGYMGVRISADWGMGLNDDTKWTDSSPMAFGGMIGFGTGMFNINAGAAYVNPKSDLLKKPISFGGNVGVTVLQPEQSPVAVNVFAGVGYTDYKEDVTDTSIWKQLDIPFGVGIGITPPTSGSVGFEIWAAPRGAYSSVDVGTKFNRFGFGVSGGVNVNFDMGFGIHAALDWSTFSEKTVDGDTLEKLSPLYLGAGLHYTFKTPS